ncbi:MULTISPECIES: hypothetical protein [Arthrobacter]|uniref:Uncharacterized protein n=1 Tax=Arthrobacter terricola TaxID=2547396 RepID=A0A4R5KPG7_9MICC|nr:MULTISPECIES: hypothetical protein [Arthrobacter]MBT8161001.1 hypothetical protein [Arthrobacter sp. GN70]TDF96865.1 hypothetical protein E1809_09075 [Arthrobacter terricola]
MTVIVPYVEPFLESETETWARANGALICLLLQSDSSHYWTLLSMMWMASAGTSRDPGLSEHVGKPLTVVEQDVVPARGVVEAMEACPEPWCASPYQLGTGVWLDEGLGCTKFSAKLIADHPDLMEVVGWIDDDGMPARDWHRLDVRIARTLRDLGYAPHRHRRSTHLHDYSKRP